MIPAESAFSKAINSDSIDMEKSRFMNQVKRFFHQIADCQSLSLRHINKGLKIKLNKPKDSMKELQNIAQEIFSMTFKQLQAKLYQFGFSINQKRMSNNELHKITFRFNEPSFFQNQSVQIQDESSSNYDQEEQIIDDFPKDEQIQQIMKIKEQKMKGFAKPNVILSKAQSDGMVGVFEKKRNFDDNSLQFKLYQQDLFSTPLAINRKSVGTHKHSEQDERHQSKDNSNLFKQNYEKCSKLIDSAMIQILTAHRNKKIGDKADQLLGKVIQIYDILSDNIENVNVAVLEYQGKANEKKEERISSPGFKPLNGLLNDNMK